MAGLARRCGNRLVSVLAQGEDVCSWNWGLGVGGTGERGQGSTFLP